MHSTPEPLCLIRPWSARGGAGPKRGSTMFPQKRRTRLMAFAAAGSLLALTACSSGGGSSDEANDDGAPSGEITVLTWRTDLVEDGTFDEYVEEFKAKYPDVTDVKVEGLTDYEGEVKTRMNTDELRRRARHPRLGRPPTSSATSSSRSATQEEIGEEYQLDQRQVLRGPVVRHPRRRQRPGLRLQQARLGGGRHHRVPRHPRGVPRRAPGHQGQRRRRSRRCTPTTRTAGRSRSGTAGSARSRRTPTGRTRSSSPTPRGPRTATTAWSTG